MVSRGQHKSTNSPIRSNHSEKDVLLENESEEKG